MQPILESSWRVADGRSGTTTSAPSTGGLKSRQGMYNDIILWPIRKCIRKIKCMNIYIYIYIYIYTVCVYSQPCWTVSGISTRGRPTRGVPVSRDVVMCEGRRPWRTRQQWCTGTESSSVQVYLTYAIQLQVIIYLNLMCYILYDLMRSNFSVLQRKLIISYSIFIAIINIYIYIYIYSIDT